MALSTFNVIVEEEIASFDESRWLLLGWLLELNEETISYFRESKDVKYIRAVLLTLMFLLKVNLILKKMFYYSKHVLIENLKF